ncbi:amino acid decarboxylase [Pseudomonas sp. CrR25]|nr:amino acid decarboxylase [Pseudomonas sp. CrR25]
MTGAALPTGQSCPAFRLSAHRHAMVDDLLNRHAGTLRELVRGLGSPLHVVLPQVFRENVRAMQQVLLHHQVDGVLLFAKKANKAGCFAHSCADLGIGLDVASTGELAKALTAGVPGAELGVTGPEKSDALLELALRQGCLVAIDALHELHRLTGMAGERRLQARVLLRSRIPSQAHSRFGLSESEIPAALRLCATHSQSIRLEGFSFHLNGYATDERAQAAGTLLDRCLHAQALGLRECRWINIGGGLPVQYLGPEPWQAFLAQDSSQHYHAGRRFSAFYPYGVARHGAQALHDVLAHRPDGDGSNLAQKLREHGIGLIIEPGRALLDQAGFSLFEVQGIKDRHATEGHALITVKGSSLSLSEQWFASEFLPDPVLLGQPTNAPATFMASVGASTCLESDMLTWRRIGFPRAPTPGDLLVYLNTAGYQMDSNESPFHEAQLPEKVVIELSDAALHWRLDSLLA